MPERNDSGQIEVGELRERLRSLGYLNAGVDRFVLAPARRERTAVGLAWRLAVRIGLLAALLLGPAAAIGVAMRLPGLITGVRDAAVITLYLALIFGAAAALVAFLVAIAARGLGRRADARTSRRAGIAAGWLVGVVCLTYLTLWWNATGAVWSAPWRTLIAIGAAVAISLVLGHTIMIAALALLAREQRRGELHAPAMSWRATIAVAVVGVAGTAGVLALTLAGAGRAAKAPLFPVVPTGVRVIVVGIDGFDPRLHQELHDRLPALSKLIARATAVAGRADTDPARVWTTIATGFPASEHGVSGLELRRVAGLEGAVEGRGRSALMPAITAVTDLLRLTRPVPVSGVVRRQKMLWEVAAEHGFDAAVVNWWATWPATNTRAIVITDRASIRLDRGGDQRAEIAPPSLYEPLRRRWPGVQARARAMAASLATTTAPEVREIITRAAGLDAAQALVARDPLLGKPDLLAVYLPGLDIAQRGLLRPEGGTPPAASSLAARLEAIRAYYLFLDRLVSELLAPGDFDVVALITHPGLAEGAQPLVAFTGRPIDPDMVVDYTPSGLPALTDVAPTVLRLIGLPVSRALPGRADRWPVMAEFERKYPVAYVDTYGRYAADVPMSEGTPLDKETMERLRSLGYIR